MSAYTVYFFGVPSHCWEIVHAESYRAAEADVARRYGLAYAIHARPATEDDLTRWARKN
jgi:hypothetical protein